ncbi:MAG: NAD(P)-binding domain-containing protein [Vicinamibacteria bacterium]
MNEGRGTRAGNVGGTLAAALAKKNHSIVLGVRDPLASKYHELAKSIGNGVEVLGIREAAASAEAILLATPWSATLFDRALEVELCDPSGAESTCFHLPSGDLEP